MGEFIVIGAGLAGASAAWHLASRGEQVTVLERATPANLQGSSHGSARIFRYAYDQDLYCRLVGRAKAGWDQWESQSGRRLMTVTGAVDYGVLRRPEQLAGVLERCGVEHELLGVADAAVRWPQFRFDTSVLWHPGVGVLDPITTVTTVLDLAVATGRARVLDGWEATGIEPTATGYRVRSVTGDTVDASGIVVAIGGWLPYLLRDLALPTAFLASFPALQVTQEQVFHFPYREDVGTEPAAPDWPTFIHHSPQIRTYGLPGGRDAGFRGLKVAEFGGGAPLSSARDQDGVVSADNRHALIDYVARYLPGLEPSPYAEATCLFTSTPTEDFVIDRADGVVVVSACSGHGAKFAPVLGELAADLALDTGGVPAEFRVGAHAARSSSAAVDRS